MYQISNLAYKILLIYNVEDIKYIRYVIFYIRYLTYVKLNKISYILHKISSIDIQYLMLCIRHMNSNITYLLEYYITILDILYLFIKYIIYNLICVISYISTMFSSIKLYE